MGVAQSARALSSQIFGVLAGTCATELAATTHITRHASSDVVRRSRLTAKPMCFVQFGGRCVDLSIRVRQRTALAGTQGPPRVPFCCLLVGARAPERSSRLMTTNQGRRR